MTERSFSDIAATTIRDGMKLKKVMLKKGTRYAKAKCPECGGWLVGRLCGNRDHIHMACDGPCKRSLMA